MLTHKELKKKMLSNPAVKAEYDSLVEEFSLFDELLKARMTAGLTQAEVAKRMGTKTPAIARLESGGEKQGSSWLLHNTWPAILIKCQDHQE